MTTTNTSAAVPITLRSAGDAWWALNRREHGFSSFGYRFAFLGEALDHFRARVVAWGRDEHGMYLLAEVSR